MSGIKFADFSRRRPKVSDPNVGKLQSREDVVSPGGCGRSLGQSLLMVTAMTALSAQLVGKRGPRQNRIRAINHDHLRCRQNTNQCPCLSGPETSVWRWLSFGVWAWAKVGR